MAIPSIRIEEAGNPTPGVAGQSRIDCTAGAVITCYDDANPATGAHIWTVTSQSGETLVLSGESTPELTFTIPAAGTYLVFKQWNSDFSWTTSADNQRISTQGGLSVLLNNGTRKHGVGETLQFSGTEGYAESFDPLFETLDMVRSAQGAAEGSLWYADANGDFQSVAPGAAGFLLTSNGSAAPTWVDPATVGGGGGGGVTALSVTDIDDPSTELNAIAGSAKGDLRLCYQTAAGGDEWTMYAWDDADGGGENVPFSVDGSSGMWSAVGGKYHRGTRRVEGQLLVASGTAGVPGIAFGVDTTHGLYRQNAGVLGHSVNGAIRQYFSSSRIYTSYSGSAAVTMLAPQSDANTGFYYPNPDEFEIVTGGNSALLLDSNQDAFFAGDVALGTSQRIQFDTDQDSYMYAAVDDDIRMFVGNTQLWRYQSAQTTTYNPFIVNENGIGESSDYGLRLQNDSSATAVLNQWAPAIWMRGKAWDTNTTATTTIDFTLQARTYSGNPITGEFALISDVAGGGDITNFTVTTAGDAHIYGEIEIDGALNHDGTEVGFFGAAPATQPTAYTLTATSVLSKTLNASASASATNNNNVLAQLITDLQSLGILA